MSARSFLAVAAATVVACMCFVSAGDAQIVESRKPPAHAVRVPQPAPPQSSSPAVQPPAPPPRAALLLPEMVSIPGGTYEIGTPLSDDRRTLTEGPRRTVTVAPFEVGRFEVTFDEWDACQADHHACGLRSDQFGRGRQPVIMVSWHDAQAYVNWLNEKRTSGSPYRLPTSDEWEVAARAGTSTFYFWNDDEPDCARGARRGANFLGCYPRPAKPATLPVGSFQPNAFGLYDMHGNVYEWVQDTVIDAEGSKRIIRGGSFLNDSGDIRSAHLGKYPPGEKVSFIGFRVARTL